MNDTEHYLAAAHAMQSGVAMEMETEKEIPGRLLGSVSATTPKSLRVGINSAMVENGALVTLLIQKGIITKEEWYKTLADAMEEEVKRYEDKLSERDRLLQKVQSADAPTHKRKDYDYNS